VTAEVFSIRDEFAFACTPHLRHGAIAAWFTRPAGVVVQFLEPVQGTLELADWLVGPAYEQLDRRFAGQNGLTLVLDLGLMAGRTSAARSVVLAKARQCRKRFGQMFIVPPYNASRAAQSSIRASVELLRVLGVHVEVVGTASRVIATCNLRSAGIAE
jgi:hypothetical protein